MYEELLDDPVIKAAIDLGGVIKEVVWLDDGADEADLSPKDKEVLKNLRLHLYGDSERELTIELKPNLVRVKLENLADYLAAHPNARVVGL